ncbi:hypothetical protein K1T71_007088 [Dendrolimus kikuchii]|uniref:Uncharacterized protein n=1 Tax=Dendrolimus kikuchii TaxID=765133 RepID=A0ACC1CZG0_9NEOP|nr:hypothetical protein K1T71_007088 [Dendrolimus kikuchii]
MILSFLMKWWWGGDPDILDPKSGLSRRDIYAIQRSWYPIYKDAGNNGVSLFIRLFRKNAETKTFFKTIKDLDEQGIMTSVQFNAHAINLMSAFNSAVVNLDKPDVVVALMNKLGASHRVRRIHKEHFEDFYGVLVHFLREEIHLGEDVLKAWDKYLEFTKKHIFEKLNLN